MIARLIEICLRQRALVIIICILVCVVGAWGFSQQPVDAYPDISAQQVLIITSFPGRAAEEIERQVTIPIELAMGSVPRVEVIRSRTIFGLSIVELIFLEGTENYFARQRVQERLSNIELPEDVMPDIGPLATAYGEIYRYQLTSDREHSLIDLRTMNDWIVIPRLQRTPGIAEVINFGGREKQFTLKLNPTQLERFGLTLESVIEAVRLNNANAGGSVLRRGDMSFVIRGRGLFEDLRDIRSTVINTIDGTPVYVRDVADVEVDSRVPTGIFGKDETPNAVEGIVLMRRGENPSETISRVRAEFQTLNTEALPEGVQAVPFYNREYLVDSTLATVSHSVVSGIALVTLVLLAFQGSPGLALLVVATIPVSLLFAFALMYATGVPIGLLSIGAIDFGILVDGAVIMADCIVRRFVRRAVGEEPRQTVLAAATHVERPIFFSMLMIICAYLPLLTLTRIEGQLFRPMALTVVYALLGAVAFALLVLPVLATFVFRKGYQEWENPLLRWSRERYLSLLDRLLRFRVAVVSGLVLAVVGCGSYIVPRLGFDFLPYLDEGVIWIRANFPEGTALEQTAEYANQMRALVRSFPEVSFVTSQAGRNDSGTDPFAPSRLEMMVGLIPHEQWSVPDKQVLLTQMGVLLRERFPTTRFNFTQPIIDSVTEDTNGTSANLAVEFSAESPELLRPLAERMLSVLAAVPGAIDVSIEQEGPQPQLVIQPDRARCARYNVQIDAVNRLINTALGGEPVGTLYEGDRRFAVVARYHHQFFRSPEAIGRLPVFSESGVPIPLSQLAKFELTDGQTFIARENGRRRVTVRCDIVGRDQGSFVADAKRRFAETMTVPDGVRVRWIGMFQNLERASQHFALVIPITIAIIYGLLVLTFGRQREAMLVLVSVPFAFLGGAAALYIRGMTLNVSSGTGFAALFGVSMMNGVLMMEAIAELRTKGLTTNEAVMRGARELFRPIMLTSLVAILGLLPASLATGLGSDIQRPLATVIVWGLFSATALTLILLPLLCQMFLGEHPKEEHAS